MPTNVTPQTAFRSFLYGGAAMLLAFDIFFLLKALFIGNFLPILPLIAGILTACGLLFVVYAEHRAREEDKRDHRRISRVAHQLESPLHALETDLVELLGGSNILPGDVRWKLKHMETKTQVLIENIRDVFLMLQAQEHPVSQEVRIYDINVLVTDVIKRYETLAKARNVEILYKQDSEHAKAKVDKRLFLIVASHIIENAILYTTTPGLVNILVRCADKKVRIIVQDRGVGVTSTDAPVIFQPFARGAKAMEYDTDGIGIGLTLSRLLIREFKGNIQWYNRPEGMGSVFEISLPRIK